MGNAQSLSVNAIYGFSLSMINLLSLIVDSNLKKVIVKGKDYEICKWIGEVWQTDKGILAGHYEENAFDIRFKEEVINETKWSMFVITQKFLCDDIRSSEVSYPDVSNIVCR